jgi:hypothetical protein
MKERAMVYFIKKKTTTAHSFKLSSQLVDELLAAVLASYLRFDKKFVESEFRILLKFRKQWYM